MTEQNLTPLCPYCGGLSRKVTGAAIYPHRQDLHKKVFYLCDNEHPAAYVGCHPGTSKPLGRLADAALRKDKSAAHAAFDPIWKSKKMSRGSAYKWLAKKLGIDQEDCHIGMFDRVTCRKVVSVVNESIKAGEFK